MNRFYHSKPININENIVMDDFAAHHAIKVLRIKNDDKLILFNGDGSDYHGQVININKKNNQIELFAVCEKEIRVIVQIEDLQNKQIWKRGWEDFTT